MNLRKAIEAKVAEIEADERYQSGTRQPATIDINAPLAMTQLVLETQRATLRWVLMKMGIDPDQGKEQTVIGQLRKGKEK